MSLSSHRLFVTLVVVALGLGQATLSAAPPSKGGRLTLKIHDTFPGNASGVRGDGVRHDSDPSFSFYVDNTLPGGELCVTANLQSSGFAFIWLDWWNNTGDCASLNSLTPRTFVLQLPTNACAALGIGHNPCTLRMDHGVGEEPLSHPRIRLSNLYSKKARSPVAFLFVYNAVSYEVRSDADVPFTKTGNTWTLVNNPISASGQSFSLWEISSSGAGCPCNLAAGFDLAFDLIVNKP